MRMKARLAWLSGSHCSERAAGWSTAIEWACGEPSLVGLKSRGFIVLAQADEGAG